MWKENQDMTAPTDEPILLFEPISQDSSVSSKNSKNKKQRNRLQRHNQDPYSSFIGGYPSYFPQDEEFNKNSTHQIHENFKSNPMCGVCKEGMYLILQMYAPLGEEERQLDRTLYVFGCNKASCIRTIFGGVDDDDDADIKNDKRNDRRFSLGGSDIIRCLRSQQSKNIKVETEKNLVQESSSLNAPSGKKTSQQQQLSSWGDDNDDSGGWGVDDSDNDWNDASDSGSTNMNDICDRERATTTSMDDLEAMLTALEESTNEQAKVTSYTEVEKKKGKTKTGKVSNNTSHSDVVSLHNNSCNSSSNPAFLRYELEMYEEKSLKINRNIDNDSDDEDYIGVSSKGDNDVQKMLAKYLTEEDDEDILAAIGGSSGTNGNKSGSGEKYERLPPEERAFLAFQDTIKKAPRQVARYGYGAIPLWSIPTPLTQPKGKKKGQSRDLSFPKVPPCPCGSERAFEFQLMPSTLHVLNVDQYSDDKQQQKKENTSLGNRQSQSSIEHFMNNENGGMNWGVVAVYSCAVSCNSNREEFVVVQESADGSPKKRVMKHIGGDGAEDDEDDLGEET